MANYDFVTVWRLEAPIDRVYDAIADSLRWPEWWSTVTAVEQVRAGDSATGVGDVRRYTFKGSLPYTLSFDLEVERLERPVTLAGRATGELRAPACGPSARMRQAKRSRATTGTSGRRAGG
jgi:uncharacterized protein YndB with AHSA1/START domain